MDMMLTIGERINASRKSIAGAVRERDAQIIRAEAEMQLRGGALMLDVNGGSSAEEEMDNMMWLIDVVAAKTAIPLSIDSANPAVIEAAIARMLQVRGVEPPAEWEIEPGLPWLMLNSISGEKKRFDAVLPLVKKYNTAVVALCMDDYGLPTSAEARVQIGSNLVRRLVSEGVERSRIYIDPLIMPVGVNSENGVAVFEVTREMKKQHPGVRTVCGLSNVSYGMPMRAIINRAFLCLMIGAGLDAAILDTSDTKLMSALHASLVLCNRDPYCAKYIKAFREKLLDA